MHSTCSWSPIEKEAVISAALRNWGPHIKLLDCSKYSPELIRSSSLIKWNVVDKDDKVKKFGGENILNSFFPPNKNELKLFNLERGIRVYLHKQNTGGFFILSLEKNNIVENNNSRKKY